MWSEEWIDLVLPRCCRGCGRPGALFCAGCLAIVRTERASLRFPIAGGPQLFAAGGEHVGVLRAAVLAHKQRPNRSISGALSALLGQSLVTVAEVLRAHDSWRPPVGLVPMPSSSRRTPRQPVVELLLPLVEAIPGLSLCTMLRSARSRPPQKGLDAAGRARNVADAFTYAPDRGRLPATVILVDDVVTTGASMASGHSVLAAAGQAPIAAIALATADVVGR